MGPALLQVGAVSAKVPEGVPRVNYLSPCGGFAGDHMLLPNLLPTSNPPKRCQAICRFDLCRVRGTGTPHQEIIGCENVKL